MGQIAPRLVVLILILLLTNACTVGLGVQRSVKEETKRVPMPGGVAELTAQRSGEQLVLRVRRQDKIRVEVFESTTITRYRKTDIDGIFIFLDALNPAAYVWDLCVAVSAPFRSDFDIAWGPLGGLAAVVVPGVSTWAGAHSDEYLYDTSSSRRLVSTRIESVPAGVVTDLRVATDQNVLTLRTNERGEATLPLTGLFRTEGPQRTRVTVDHVGALYAVDIDGTRVRVVPVESATR